MGGDGFVFAIQAPDASLGEAGGGLGIAGVHPSVAVEFDTWFDSPAEHPAISDPDSSHVGIDVNGDVKSVVTAGVTPFMNDGMVWYAWIDYDGTTLSVRLNETGARPDVAQLEYAIDIPAILGVRTAYVGLAAGTASAWQNHDVLRWTYHDIYVDAGVGPDSTVGAENPDADFNPSTPIPLPPDGGDAGDSPDGQVKPLSGGGCSCQTAPGPGRALALPLLLGLALLGARRRR